MAQQCAAVHPAELLELLVRRSAARKETFFLWAIAICFPGESQETRLAGRPGQLYPAYWICLLLR